MALDVDRLTVAMRDAAVTEVLALGYGGVDEAVLQEGVEAIAKGFAAAIVAELQAFAAVPAGIEVKDTTLTTVIGYTSTDGTVT
jgi:hypothetical protein